MNDIAHKHLLTIGIPVYCGAEFIQGTLDSIAVAYEKLASNQKNIEVIVSDNASTDNTAEIVKNYANDFLKVTYYCNESNIGYDANLDKIVQLSTGKYVWFFGCGELMKPDALVKLSNELSDSQAENYLLGFDVFDQKSGVVKTAKSCENQKKQTVIGRNNFCYPRYQLAMPANIVSVSSWRNVINNPLRGTSWAHVERILDIISSSDKAISVILLDSHFTLLRDKNGWWTNPDSSLLEMTIRHVIIINSMRERGFSSKLVDELIRRESGLNLLGVVLDARIRNVNVNKKTKLKMKNCFKPNIFFKSIIACTLVLPRWLLIFPRLAYKFMRVFKGSI